MNYSLILFDLDWTLARPSSGATFRHPGEPYVWLEGAKELLETLHAQGVEIAIGVNQGGRRIFEPPSSKSMFSLSARGWFLFRNYLVF